MKHDCEREKIMDRRDFVKSAAMITGASALSALPVRLEAEQTSDAELQQITIRSGVATGSFPHVWEACVGSDRASVGMRAQWQTDLERVAKQVGVKGVRFHGLFSEEMGVWPSGAKTPNFLYVDTVFDAMLDRGVKPLVELSFMPAGLASGTQTCLFYRGNVTPPKDMNQWAELIRAFAEHIIGRYGLAEISTWSFEVWNEPNLKFFWSGTKEDYFELYRQAALALKGVSPKLHVGGPSTAQAAWVGDLLDFCASKQVPIDFVTSHIYPDDQQKIVFGEGVHYPYEEVIPQAIAKMKGQIAASKFPQLPLYITEWSSQNPAFIAHTLKGAVGIVDVMSYWTFDSVYEELGIQKAFVSNAFGLIGPRGVPRQSFYTFALLHRLGESKLDASEGPVMATRRSDGSLAEPDSPGTRATFGCG